MIALFLQRIYKSGRPLHDSTSRGIFVTKRRRITNFGGAGTCQLVDVRVVGLPHVSSRRFLVVDSRRVGVCDDVVGYVGPELGLLAGTVSDTRHHFGRLDVSNDGGFIGFPVDVDLLHSLHPFQCSLHFPLTSFAVDSNFQLHCLVKFVIQILEF